MGNLVGNSFTDHWSGALRWGAIFESVSGVPGLIHKCGQGYPQGVDNACLDISPFFAQNRTILAFVTQVSPRCQSTTIHHGPDPRFSGVHFFHSRGPCFVHLTDYWTKYVPAGPEDNPRPGVPGPGRGRPRGAEARGRAIGVDIKGPEKYLAAGGKNDAEGR